ncbi:uncharacterized protein LOC124408305 [Diprion similis]|uniref:uncharacterized protein LOC124408305 n=1 Tax=Diprion similis TaxID=362088 RepID=UPI001EF97CEE|nr:uncharacterized protein LOC124408305 [Diprion similis]
MDPDELSYTEMESSSTKSDVVGITANELSGVSCGNCDSEVYGTSVKSLDYHVAHLKSSKRKIRSITLWIVKLNDDDQVVVEGNLECGTRVRTKSIAKRITSSRILSKFKHAYHLIGNMADLQCELPVFVRRKFHHGFPEDWEAIISIWKSFIITSECNEATRSLCTPEGLFVNEKLTIDGFNENSRFIQDVSKGTRVDEPTYPMNKNGTNGSISEHYQNDKLVDSLAETETGKSILDHDVCDKISRTPNYTKQLTAWTPLLQFGDNAGCYLSFRGTLLSSMGHAVNRNHVTGIVRRRISPRIIETINQEFYELMGDLNNTKHSIPKELILWCRNGCPKQINLFCEQWRLLKSDEIESSKRSVSDGKLKDEDNDVSHTNHHKESGSYSKKVHALSPMQTPKNRIKRKRILTDLNDNRDTNNSIINYTTSSKKEASKTSTSTLQVSSLSKIRRKLSTYGFENSKEDTNIADIDLDENFKSMEEIRPTTKHNTKHQRLPLSQEPVISYIYHESFEVNDNDLSDGV